LLKKQLAIGNFDPLKPLFVDLHSLAKLKVQTLPHIAPLPYALRAGGLPTVIFNLSSLTAKYNRGIELTTVGEFGKALDAFRSCI